MKKEDTRNIKYFNNIDTEAKAYFLGLIYADGNIHKDLLQLTLKEEDKYLLEELNNAICPLNKLCCTKRSIKNEKWSDVYKFSVHSKELVNDLRKLGLVDRKRYHQIGIPIIDYDLIRHFIRGFLDGDGHILCKGDNTVRKNGWNNYVFHRRILFTNSSMKLLNDISLFLQKELGVDGSKYTKSNGTGSKIDTFTLHFYRIPDVQKIISFLYKDSIIRMERKYDKAKLCMLTPREFRKLTDSKPRNA